MLRGILELREKTSYIHHIVAIQGHRQVGSVKDWGKVEDIATRWVADQTQDGTD